MAPAATLLTLHVAPLCWWCIHACVNYNMYIYIEDIYIYIHTYIHPYRERHLVCVWKYNIWEYFFCPSFGSWETLCLLLVSYFSLSLCYSRNGECRRPLHVASRRDRKFQRRRIGEMKKTKQEKVYIQREKKKKKKGNINKGEEWKKMKTRARLEQKESCRLFGNQLRNTTIRSRTSVVLCVFAHTGHTPITYYITLE